MLEISKSVEKTFDCDGLKAEFVADVVTYTSESSIVNQNETELIYKTIDEIQDRIDELNSDIDKLPESAKFD